MADAAFPDAEGPDGLIVLLPAADGGRWHWWRVSGGRAGRDMAFDPEVHTAPWGEAGRVTVLVPAGDAPVLDRALPDMPEAQALAAERLAAAQSALGDGVVHVAVAAHEGRLLSCRVDDQVMTHWLALLKAQGIDPVAMVPAGLVLPRREGTVMLADLCGQMLARTAEAAFAAEPGLVPALAGAADQAALEGDALALRLAEVHAAPPLNLRQGRHAQKSPSAFRAGEWLGLARMAAVAALLALALMVVWVVKWNADSAAEQARALEMAQQRFPQATDLDAAERLLNAEMARRGVGGTSFAAPSAALLDAMRGAPGMTLRALAYDADGTLRFTAAAPRAEDVNAVLIALQNEGWKVTVPPALAPDPTGAIIAAITVRAP